MAHFEPGPVSAYARTEGYVLRDLWSSVPVSTESSSISRARLPARDSLETASRGCLRYTIDFLRQREGSCRVGGGRRRTSRRAKRGRTPLMDPRSNVPVVLEAASSPGVDK